MRFKQLGVTDYAKTKSMDRSQCRSIRKKTFTAEESQRLFTPPITSFADYTAEDLASWWLKDDYVLSGTGLSSQDKASVIWMLALEGKYDFIRLIQMNWSDCDDFHEYTEDFRTLFKLSKKFADDAVLEEDREWWDSLPDTLEVFRGCESNRVFGLSWTLDRAVAKNFAKGHRSISLKKPTLATAQIPKSAVFYATDSRKEQEVVWDTRMDGIKISRKYKF
jgi:hypothetical protein